MVMFVEGIVDYFVLVFDCKGLNLIVFVDLFFFNFFLGDVYYICLVFVELIWNVLDYIMNGGVGLEFFGGCFDNGLYRFMVKVVDLGFGV